MKMQITFRSGAQIEADVTELTTKRNPLTKELVGLDWITPAVWARKLHTLELDQVVAIVTIEDQDAPMVPGKESE